jgi:hypothetical protein
MIKGTAVRLAPAPSIPLVRNGEDSLHCAGSRSAS